MILYNIITKTKKYITFVIVKNLKTKITQKRIYVTYCKISYHTTNGNYMNMIGEL